MLSSVVHSGTDKRRANRHQVSLAGRYLLADRTEWDCRTANISATGVLLRGQAPPYSGQIVVVYLSVFGRIEGSVVRLTPHGFVLTIEATDRKREQLAMWLEKLANGESASRRIDPVVLGKVIEQAALRAHSPPQALIAESAPMHRAVHPATTAYRTYLDALLG